MSKNRFFLGNVDDDGDFSPLISVDSDDSVDQESIPKIVPVLALKNTVLFPGVVIPITIGRDKSIKAVRKAYDKDKFIAVHSQREIKNEDPEMGDLYEIGCMAQIVKMIKMPDGSTTAILQGKIRSELLNLTKLDPYLEGQINLIQDDNDVDKMEISATMSSVKDLSLIHI